MRLKTFFYNRTVTTIAGIAVLVSFVGLVLQLFVGLVLQLIEETIEGRGIQHYTSGFGYKLSPIGVLTVLALIPVALVIGLICRYLSKKDERDFKRKYKIEEDSKL